MYFQRTTKIQTSFLKKKIFRMAKNKQKHKQSQQVKNRKSYFDKSILYLNR